MTGLGKSEYFPFLISSNARDELFGFSLEEMIDGAGLSKTTFYKTWRDIVRSGIVRISRRSGETELYSLNGRNSIVKELKRLELILICNQIKSPS